MTSRVRTRRRPARLLALLLMFVALPFAARAATTIVVEPASTSGWTPSASGAATGTYDQGPGAPPLGSGAFRQIVPASSDRHALVNSAFNGKTLTALTKLSYSTFVVQNQGGQAAFIKLRIDNNSDGTPDDALTFEPAYQSAAYPMVPGAGSIPNQCSGITNCAGTGMWQSWNAKAGGWWADSAMTSGPPLDTLAHYAAVHPGARLATTVPAFLMQTGSGWTNYEGAFDALTVGVSGSDTTYDFEAGLPVVVTVYPFELRGWSTVATGTGSGSFVFGPGTAPGPSIGSFRQQTPAANDRQFVESKILNGRALSDIHSLSYSTYSSDAPRAAVLQLDVDIDSDGLVDETLKFEPHLQTGAFAMVPGAGPVPNQCAGVPGCVANGQWQTWDADAGAWWSTGGGTPPFDTLAHYASTHPGAKVALVGDSVSSVGAALRLASGSSGSAWAGYVGSFDRVRIDQTIFDFEPISLAIDCDAVSDDMGAIQAAVNGAANGSTITLSGICDFTAAPAHGGDITSIVNTAILVRPGTPVNGLTITSAGASQSATILGSGTEAAFTIAPGNTNVTIKGLTFVNLARSVVAISTDGTTVGAIGAVPDPSGNRIIAGPTGESEIMGLSVDRNPATQPAGTVRVNYGAAATPGIITGANGAGLKNFTVAGNYITFAGPGPGAPADVVGIDVRERFGAIANGITIKNNAVGMLAAAFPTTNIKAINIHSLSPLSGAPTGTVNDYFIRNVTVSGNNLGRLEELPDPLADINAAGRVGIHLTGVGGFTVNDNGVRVFLSPTAIPMPGGGIVVGDSGFGKIGPGNGINVLAEPSTETSDLGAIGIIDDLGTVFAGAPKPQPTRDILIEGNRIGTYDPNTDGINQRGLVVTGSSLITARNNVFELTTAKSINIAALVEGPGSLSSPGTIAAPADVTASTFCGNTLQGIVDDPNEVAFGDGGTAGSISNNFPGGSGFSGNGECVPAAVLVTPSGTGTEVTEGNPVPDTYSVALSFRPVNNVTVTLNPGTQLSVVPASLTFTPLNWQVPQTVAVNAIDDLLVEGTHLGTVAHVVSSADSAYNAITAPSLTAVITDNDLGSVAITPTLVNLTEGQPGQSYSTVLTAAPPVNVTVTGRGSPQVSLAPSSLTFTPLNWNQPQQVIATAVDDTIREGTMFFPITHTTSSANASWNNLAAPTVLASIVDNDPPAAPIVSAPGTRVCSPSVFVTGNAEPGATVEVYEGATLLASTTATASGYWIAGPVTLSPGTHTISVRQIATDTLASSFTVRTVEVDTVAPSAPAITSPVALSTVTTRPVTVTGTGDPGSVVYVRINGVPVAVAGVAANGTWRTQVTLGSGSHTIDAIASDACQFSSPSASVTFTVDIPVKPVIITPLQNSLNRASVLVTGTAGNGTQIRLFEGPNVIAEGVAVASGSWSISLTFSDGLHTIKAQAYTPNAVSDVSVARTFQVDALPPVVSIRRPANTVLVQIFTPFDTLRIRGTARDTVGVDRIQVSYQNLLTGASTTTTAVVCDGCPAGNVSWSDEPALLPGLYSIEAIAYDLVGNASLIAEDLLLSLSL